MVPVHTYKNLSRPVADIRTNACHYVDSAEKYIDKNMSTSQLDKTIFKDSLWLVDLLKIKY